MSVTVQIPSAFRKVTRGDASAVVAASSVRIMLQELCGRYAGLREHMLDQRGELQRFVNIFVNGLDVRFCEGLDTALNDGDDVQIVPAIAGGIDPDRFSRQFVLRDFGPDGQRRMERASVELTGDPGIIETTSAYLNAAGTGKITLTRGEESPGCGASRIADASSPLRAVAGREFVECGREILGHPSPLASIVSLQAAGMLLAIETMKEIVGVGAAGRFRLDLSRDSQP